MDADCRYIIRIDQHSDAACRIVEQDHTDCALICDVLVLLREGEIAADDESNFTFDFIGDFFGRALAAVYEFKGLIAECIEPAMFAVVAVVNIRESFAVVFDCEGRICEVFHGSDGDVAFIGGRACNFCVVRILGKDITVACKVAGLICHGVFVTCGDADDHAGLIELLVDVAELFIEFPVINEAARCTDRHVDCINAEEEAVFQCRHVNTGVRSGCSIGENLHEYQLRIRSRTHEFDCPVIFDRKTADRTGNVRTVTIVIRYIVVSVIVVVGERNLYGDVLAGNGCFNGGNILLGKRRFCDDAVILERFVRKVQTGVQNCSDHTVTEESDALHRISAGDDVCIFLRGFLYDRSFELIRNINLFHAIHLLHRGNVLVCRLDGHTVDQSGVIIHTLCFERQCLEEGVVCV